MNAMDMSNLPLDDDLLALLQPLSESEPCGPAMRYDPVFTEIRLAREEDDPHLPMRQWERPLKKADWPLIERLCVETLSTRTKDLQLAAWLLEAWTRQRGFAGLGRGLQVLHELLTRFWEPLHPLMEDGDCDARVAPLEWINEALPLTLKVHVTLLTLVDRKPSRVSFADWERLTASELAGQPEQDRKPASPDVEPPLTRNEVVENVRRQGGSFVKTQLADVREALGHLDLLSRSLDQWLGVEAPNVGKLRGTLAAIERVLVGLPTAPQPALKAEPVATETVDSDDAHLDVVPLAEDELMDINDPGLGQPEALPGSTAARTGWRSREEAYRTLDALADYLGRVEPHSPTPYLIRRAVKWGRMSLPNLMREILQEEGDLNQLFKLVAGEETRSG